MSRPLEEQTIEELRQNLAGFTECATQANRVLSRASLDLTRHYNTIIAKYEAEIARRAQ